MRVKLRSKEMEQNNEQNRITVTTNEPIKCNECGKSCWGNAYRTKKEYRRWNKSCKNYYCSEACAHKHYRGIQVMKLGEIGFDFTDKHWNRVLKSNLEPVYIMRKE